MTCAMRGSTASAAAFSHAGPSQEFSPRKTGMIVFHHSAHTKSLAMVERWRKRDWAGMEWADAGLRLVVVGQCVLLPFAVVRVSVEPYVGMNRYSIIGQGALVDALPDRCCNRLRCCRVKEKRPGLKNEHDAWTKISAATVLIGGRRSDHEHLAALKCELPKGIIGGPVCDRIAIVLMKELQDLPEARDK